MISIFKRFIRRISIVAVIIGLCGGVVGCSSNEKPTPEVMKDKALNYLNSMYDDAFTPISYTGPSWAYSHSTVIFSSAKFDGETVEVQITKDKGQYSFTDNYFKLNMLEDAEKYFKAIVKDKLDNVEVKVRFFDPKLPKGLPGNATFNDYIETQECFIEVLFISAEIPVEEQREVTLNAIAENKVMGYYHFIETIDEKLFSECTVGEVLTKKSNYISERIDYSINQNFDISKR